MCSSNILASIWCILLRILLNTHIRQLSPKWKLWLQKFPTNVEIFSNCGFRPPAGHEQLGSRGSALSRRAENDFVLWKLILGFASRRSVLGLKGSKKSRWELQLCDLRLHFPYFKYTIIYSFPVCTKSSAVGRCRFPDFLCDISQGICMVLKAKSEILADTSMASKNVLFSATFCPGF